MNEHLTKEQYEELRGMLQARRQELREEIAGELARREEENFQNLAGQVHDAEDASVADMLIDLNMTEIAYHVREIREVEDALLRMRERTYGICVDTGEPIPYERLKAQPAARRTLEAQERHEATYSGDVST